MVTADSFKKEIANLKASRPCQSKEKQEQTERLLFYSYKLIELSRNPDPAEEAKLNREIEEFNAKHPLSKDDILRIEPYKEVIEKAGWGNDC